MLESLPDYLLAVHNVLDRFLSTTKLRGDCIVRDLFGNEVKHFSLLLERQPHPGSRWLLLFLLRNALFRVARLALTIPGRAPSGAVVILVARRAHAVHLSTTLRDLLATHIMQCSVASSVATVTRGLARCWGIGDFAFQSRSARHDGLWQELQYIYSYIRTSGTLDLLEEVGKHFLRFSSGLRGVSQAGDRVFGPLLRDLGSLTERYSPL